MVVDAAIGIDAAQARTGVNTLLVAAGLVWGAVRINHTFWPTVGRSADHSRAAGTVAAIPNNTGRIAVGAAWVGIAGIVCHYRFDGWNYIRIVFMSCREPKRCL
jgi:hypothetical protein